MSSCAVATCKNHYKKTKGQCIVYHAFPVKNPHLVKEWLRSCSRLDPVNITNARICSEHFQNSDYDDDIKNRLLGLQEKKMLKPNAVPNLKLPNCEEKMHCVTPRTLRKRKRNILQRALDRMETLSPKKICLYETPELPSEAEETSEDTRCPTCMEVTKENGLLLEKVASLEKEIELLKQEKIKLLRVKAAGRRKRKLRMQRILSENRLLKTKIKIIDAKNRKMLKMEARVKNVLTSTQLNAIIEGKKKIIWTAEDISRGIVTRALSRKSYEFWKNKIGVPLPSASTLKRWCAKFSCRPGILYKVLLLMKRSSETMTEAEKACILSFDEMHIDNKLCYDTSEDQILGPFSKVQFVLARGIVSPWKQPVFFDFQRTMTKELLFSVIKSVENSGVKVNAIVSDLGGCATLWKELQISPETSSFPHPCDGKKRIWVFADLPHCIKLLRNHFIDSGLKLEDGTHLTSTIIKDVFDRDRGELRICHKLKPNFLTVKGNERQKVAPAKTLFSATTAKAILLLTGNQKASNFFELVDSFFDVMNSSRPYPPSNKPMQAAFVIESYMTRQKEILRLMSSTVFGMRVVGKKNMLPFQKGLLVSISSLLGLHEDMKAFGVVYIMTSRLTQDALESLFSQIRGIGNFYDHPSPIEVISRLKHLLLANKLPALSTKVNTGETSAVDCYLTADLLKNAFEEKDVEEIVNGTSENVTDDFQMCTKLCEEPVPMSWKAEQNNSSCLMSFTEHEALKYVAGYIAYRVRHKDPSLGTVSKNAGDDLDSSVWIKVISEGNLTVPTADWLRTVEEFETIFISIHGKEGAHRGKRITKELKEILEEKYPQVSKDAISLYSRVRTFIRLRYLNRKATLCNRKSDKKMKKWIQSSCTQGSRS